MENKKITRVVILTRVSTNRQETENQLIQLRQYCTDLNYKIVLEIQENISGGKDKRKGIDQAIEMASQGKYDLLLFWNLDRFSRFGIFKTMQYFEILESFGIKIKSYTQPYLDTSNDMIRPLLLAFFSYMASFQLARYSEDIKSGQDRARKQGKRIGRPKISPEAIQNIKKLKTDGLSNRKIALKLKIDEKTIRNYYNSLY